jgi:hypothetical protein
MVEIIGRVMSHAQVILAPLPEQQPRGRELGHDV